MYVHHVMKDSHHGPLVSGSSVFESKWHDDVTISSPRCSKRGLLFILFSHLDLIVPGVTVHKRQHLIPCGVVNKNIYVWKREVVFRASSIKITKINTNPYPSILFHDWNDISHPVGIQDDPDKLGL